MAGKTILICPLDWGLGHGSRCIPLIKAFLQQGHQVIIAADKGPAALLKGAFPDLKHVTFPGLEIRYPENGNFAAYMMKTTPDLIRQTALEEEFVGRLVQEYGIDVVVSDNRYGARCKSVKSIFITHQLFVRGTPWTRWLEPVMKQMTWHYIRKFDACWVPDFESTPNLSGSLAHGSDLPLHNTRYIGPLSRFGLVSEENPEIEIPDLLAVLSGPEPQRSMLEKIIVEQSIQYNIRTTIIQGKPGEGASTIEKGIQKIPHLSDGKLKYLLKRCSKLICRSGYSTLMDIQHTGTPALLIPTPGQTEQEYLARLYAERGWYSWRSQKALDLKRDLAGVREYHPPCLISDVNLGTLI